jgi:hypothetical protein
MRLGTYMHWDSHHDGTKYLEPYTVTAIDDVLS